MKILLGLIENSSSLKIIEIDFDKVIPIFNFELIVLYYIINHAI